SGGGIAQLAKDRISEGVTAKEVFEAAISGDVVAEEIVKISAEYLGKGLAILIDILNPECIVIGSIYARNEDILKPYIEKILSREAIPAANKVCKIVPAALGESIGDYAALSVAMN
ncbi:MAG: ROK family protein, partial [Bacteroidales bacterium]|nr:ROK family protein [Bacteroidales bacterium]